VRENAALQRPQVNVGCENMCGAMWCVGCENMCVQVVCRVGEYVCGVIWQCSTAPVGRKLM